MKNFKEFKKLNEKVEKLTFADIFGLPKQEVYITRLYNDKSLEKFGIVKSKDINWLVYDHDEVPVVVHGMRCHVSGYDYADIDFEDQEDLNSTMKEDNKDGYTVFSNYQDALEFYEDNI